MNPLKVIVITGASKGIGEAIAKIFAVRGSYNIVLISRHYLEVEKTAKEIEKNFVFGENIKVLPLECDVSDEKQVKRVFEEIYKKFGSVDVLINNAGINSRRTIGNLDSFEEDLNGFREELSINLTGTFICSYVAAKYMLKNKSGSIVNISSIKGKEPTSSPGYGASKAGIIKLTKDFAKSLAPSIRVNCVAPGFIDTGMTTELSEEKKQTYRKMIPMLRFGDVEEIAKAVFFLTSDESSYITGATLDVNGGYLMS